MTDAEEKAHSARHLAAYVLIRMAATLSSGLASFSSWMIVGCAAILGLIVANLETVTEFIPAVAVSRAIVLFLIALGLNLLQRYLSGMVVAAGDIVRELRETKWTKEIDIDVFLAEMERAIIWPMRTFVTYMNRRLKSGDLAVSGRFHTILAQVQGLLVLIQMVLLVFSIGVLAYALAK
jgi:hypothetical protein